MIDRLLYQKILHRLQQQAAVAIIGPRQVGKTTLALSIGNDLPALYLDLENEDDRAKLDEPSLFFEHSKDKLLILDEIHRVPELFSQLRGVIDRGRREGHGVGRFLLLGSASMDLLRQSSETLAGRIAYLELTPLQLSELKTAEQNAMETLWLRGGFPQSYLASNNEESITWRRDFIRNYLEREVSMFVGRIPTETLSRLWQMLAHRHGTVVNASELARSLNVSAQSVTRYIDLLVDLLLVRRLPPFHANISKRLVKSPKIYLRDSGILHALLGVGSELALAGHPIRGLSWEGMVIENLIAACRWPTKCYFYRTQAGAEIDCLIQFADEKLWAIEIKRRSLKTERGFYEACSDLKPERRIVVHSQNSSFTMQGGIEAMTLSETVVALSKRSQ